MWRFQSFNMGQQLISAIFLVIFCVRKIFSGDIPFPSANTANNRILALVLAYDWNGIDPILGILEEYKSMCESGWSPTITFFITYDYTPKLSRLFRQKTFCYRTNSYLPIRISKHDKSIGIYLCEETRPYLAKEINNFDIFVYQEEDMVLKNSHLSAYLHETMKLKTLLPLTGISSYSVGFIRYRHYLHSKEDLMKTKLTETDLLHLEYLEEIPFFDPICIENEPYFQILSSRNPAAYWSNPHQALFVLTREQLLHLEESCHFTKQTIKTTLQHAYAREFISSLSLFNNSIIAHNCGLVKLIPAERLMTFAINHYYYHVAATKEVLHPLFAVDEHIRAGLMQMETPVGPAGYYNNKTCFAEMVRKYREEQKDDIEAAQKIPFLVKETNSRSVYLVENGFKREVYDGNVFEMHGFNWNDIIPPPQLDVWDNLPLGPELMN